MGDAGQLTRNVPSRRTSVRRPRVRIRVDNGGDGGPARVRLPADLSRHPKGLTSRAARFDRCLRQTPQQLAQAYRLREIGGGSSGSTSNAAEESRRPVRSAKRRETASWFPKPAGEYERPQVRARWADPNVAPLLRQLVMHFHLVRYDGRALCRKAPTTYSRSPRYSPADMSASTRADKQRHVNL